MINLLLVVLAGSPLGDPSMAKANSAASTVVEERMKAERPDDHRLLHSVEAADIVVVRGTYDRVEDVLKSLKIAHVVVDPIQVATLELTARQLLIVDCPGDIGPKGIERIRKFVNAGGFLYTTDWALSNVVEKAFPGFIAKGGVESANDVVQVEVVEKQDNLLKHLTLSGEKPRWWLESSSYPIKVVNAEKVKVLISSAQMKQRYGQAPIAVMFNYGDGKVLHIVSHFYLQQNQNKSVAENKKAKDFVNSDSALTAGTKAALGKSAALDNTTAGDLGSAYSSQQMTTNIVVERKRDQARVDGLYSKELSRPVMAAPAGTKLKVLETKDNQVKVRDQ